MKVWTAVKSCSFRAQHFDNCSVVYNSDCVKTDLIAWKVIVVCGLMKPPNQINAKWVLLDHNERNKSFRQVLGSYF